MIRLHKKLSLILAVCMCMNITTPLYTQAQQGSMDNLIPHRERSTEAAIQTYPLKTTTSSIRNAGFEETESHSDTGIWKGNIKASEWTGTDSYGSSYTFTDIRLDSTEKYSGQYAAKLDATTDSSRGGIYQVFDTQPNTTYEVSFHAKTQNLQTEKFALQVYEIKSDGKFVTSDAKTTAISNISGTNDWTKYTYTFKTGSQTAKIKLQFTLGYLWKVPKNSRVWIDDISWTELNESVTGITLSDEKLTGIIGGKYTLIPAIKPASAANKAVTWYSTDSTIVAVDTKGELAFLKEGTATVTATSVEGDFTASCEVQVKQAIAIESIILSENLKLMIGETCILTPEIVPAIEGMPLNWTSSNPQVATVDAKGKVIAKSFGETKIVVTVGGKSAICKLSVISPATNKIPNGSFEEEENGLPKSFDVSKGTAQVTLDPSQNYTGKQALKIQADEGTRVSLKAKSTIGAKDVPYGINLSIKAKEATGTIKINIHQDKTDNVKIVETLEIPVQTTTSSWYQVDEIFDGINVLRNVNLDLVFEGKGNIWLDDFKFYEAISLKTIDIADVSINLNTIDYQNLPKIDYTIQPSNAHDTRVVWQSSDSSILEIKEDGTLVPKKAGTVRVTGLTQNHKVKDTAEIVLMGNLPNAQIIKVDTLTMPSDLTLEVGEGGKLIPESSPSNYTHLELKWYSSNEDIVTVYKGRLHAKAEGVATITAKDIYGTSASTTISVTPQIDDKFDQVREQWNAKIRKRYTAAEYDAKVDEYWAKMNKDSNRLFLWEDLETDYRIGIGLGDVTARLLLMATATTLPESKYYGHDELQADLADAIVWINEDYLGKEHELYRKSWHWNIGLPKDMTDLYMLLYDYLDSDEIKEGMTFVAYEATPEDIMDFSAANLVDAGKSRIGAQLLFKNEQEVTRYMNMILDTLNYTKTGNGFYEDGSFVEHDNIAYTGSYGTVLLNGLGDLVDIFGGTSFDIESNPNMLKLYKILEETYLPLMSSGGFMDNTRGRAISRPGDGDHGEGHVVVSAMIKAGYAAPEPYRTNLLSQAKRIIIEDKVHYDTMANPYVMPNVKKLLADETITSASSYIYSHEYGSMNRTVHHTEEFGMGISKSSKRIATFELLNNENKKGWNTGYGMTNLYNTDMNQYKDGYWATIDPYRLPGTTVDIGTRDASSNQYGDGEGTPSNSWVGGVTLSNTFGTSGMQLQTLRKAGSTLTANKSWFMFDDEVVAVGSNINSKDSRNAETIVENRKIDSEGISQLTINGEVYNGALNDKQNIEQAQWAHLGSTIEGASIGYYFPSPTPLTILKEKRTGNYNQIGTGNQEHTNYFTTMFIDHGVMPTEQKYAYAIVPNVTSEQMEVYAKAPSFQVVANENTLHAVKHLEHNILAANFYLDKPQQVENLYVDGNAAVMIKKDEHYLEIAVADPTMERSQVVVELLGETYSDVVKVDDKVKVEKTVEGIKLTIDTKDSASKTFETKLLIQPIAQEQVVIPTASIPSGTYNKAQKVQLQTATEDAQIYYTLNSKKVLDPNTLEEAILYKEPIVIERNTKLQVVALAKDKLFSEVATFDYIIRPDTDDSSDNSEDDANNSNNNLNNGSKDKVDKEPNDNKEKVDREDSFEKLQEEAKKIVMELADKWFNIPIASTANQGIPEKHWAQEAIGKMITLEVIKPKESTLDLNHKVTRAETVELIGRLLRITENKEGILYKDVDPEKEYANYLNVLTHLGIITGTGNEIFTPEGTLTREQMATLLIRLIGAFTEEEIKVEVITPFEDEDISTWAENYIQEAFSIGIIQGVGNGMFLPQKEVSLAETLVMLDRTMSYIAELN